MKKSLQIFPDKIGILQRYEWLMLNKEETELLKIKFRDSATFICAMKVMRASKYEITARDILDILENKKVCDPDKHMMIVSSIFSELTKVSGVDIYAAFKMFYLTK